MRSNSLRMKVAAASMLVGVLAAGADPASAGTVVAKGSFVGGAGFVCAECGAFALSCNASLARADGVQGSSVNIVTSANRSRVFAWNGTWPGSGKPNAAIAFLSDTCKVLQTLNGPQAVAMGSTRSLTVPANTKWIQVWPELIGPVQASWTLATP